MDARRKQRNKNNRVKGVRQVQSRFSENHKEEKRGQGRECRRENQPGICRELLESDKWSL
jgi:hypothetical protein